MRKYLTSHHFYVNLAAEVTDIATTCQHGNKVSCTECGGPVLCEHNRRAYQCRLCQQGPAICPHDKHKQSCVVCSPASIRRKYELDAIRMNRIFQLSLEEFVFIVSQPCFYCGTTTEQCGIDRWDNVKGYLISNCLPCCKVCNMMKRGMQWSDFIQQAKEISWKHRF